jgi:hypothetical protein
MASMSYAAGDAAQASHAVSAAPVVDSVDAPTVTLPRTCADPVHHLVDRLRPAIRHPVDALQVAASLESDGITDRAARVEYGYPDVFLLAEAVFARLHRRAPVVVPVRERAQVGRAVRDISHGLLYLLPSALFPVAVAVVGRDAMAAALVAASGLGWVWSAVAAWVGYRLLGRGLADASGSVLRWSTLASVPIGAAAGFGAVLWSGGDLRVVVLTVGQLVYQMAATVALFYRREGWLMLVFAPGAVVALCHLAFGRPTLLLAVGAAAMSLGLALILALGQTLWPDRAATVMGVTPQTPGGSPPARLRRGESRQLCWVLLYATLSAAFLLTADARYLTGAPDVALACAPLVVGMGLVEWRARWFSEQARRLVGRVQYPREFTAAVWLRLAVALSTATAMVALLAVPMVVWLRRTDQLSPAGSALITAHVAVAGAYLLAFLLAGYERYGWLCAALATATAAQVAPDLIVPGGLSPAQHSLVFLGSAVLLQLLLLTALVRVVGQAWRYR